MNLPRIIIDAVLFCPHCGARHVDEARNGEKWHRRAHTTHRCQACGGDFDVYVSGQAQDEQPVKTKPKPSSGSSALQGVVDLIQDALGRSGIHSVTLVGDADLEFPLATLDSRCRSVKIKITEVSK